MNYAYYFVDDLPFNIALQIFSELLGYFYKNGPR